MGLEERNFHEAVSLPFLQGNMNQRQIERKRKKECARGTIGFGDGVSFSEGLVIGADDLSGLRYQSSPGVVIPWKGNEHIKILISKD